MHTDAVMLSIQVFAVLTSFDLCDHMGFYFLTCLRFQWGSFTVVWFRSLLNAAGIAIMCGVTTYSPDYDGCTWSEGPIRFKIHSRSAVVSGHCSMLCGLVKKRIDDSRILIAPFIFASLFFFHFKQNSTLSKYCILRLCTATKRIMLFFPHMAAFSIGYHYWIWVNESSICQ